MEAVTAQSVSVARVFETLRRARSLAAAVFLALCTAPLAGQKLPSETEKWLRVQTPHFTLFGEAGEGKMRDVALELERLHGYLGQSRPSGRVNAPVPTTVYVFSGRRAIEPYLPRDEKGKPRPIDGYFFGSRDSNTIVLTAAWNTDPRPLVYHEYLHYYMQVNFPPQPVWYGEGLAEFFSTFRATRTEAQIGLPVEDHVLLLRDTGLMPLEKLFAVTTDSPEYDEAIRRGIFYAQSWALVHMFLRGEPNRREPFGKFLLQLQNGVPFAKAFPEAFGMEPRQMLHELAAYIRSSRFFYARVPFREETQKVEANATPLPYDETLARLGDLLSHHPSRSEDAEAYLSASVQRNPANVTALTSLAILREGQERGEEADALLARAVATGRADFRTDYRHGVRLMRSLSDTLPGSLSASQQQTLAQARAAFRASIQKNGEFAEARVALGRTYLGERGEAVAEGIAQLEEAARRLPSRPDVLFELSRLYEAKGDRTRADEAMKKAVGTEAAAALTRKRDSLDLEETVARVNGLLAQGKEDEAVALFEKLVAAADPEARTILEEDLRKLKAGAARNRAVKEFNLGVEFANRNDYESALSRFETVAASPDAAPELVASARAEAERLRGILARRPKKTPSRN